MIIPTFPYLNRNDDTTLIWSKWSRLKSVISKERPKTFNHVVFIEVQFSFTLYCAWDDEMISNQNLLKGIPLHILILLITNAKGYITGFFFFFFLFVLFLFFCFVLFVCFPFSFFFFVTKVFGLGVFEKEVIQPKIPYKKSLGRLSCLCRVNHSPFTHSPMQSWELQWERYWQLLKVLGFF